MIDFAPLQKDRVRPRAALRYLALQVKLSVFNILREVRFRREVLASAAPLSDLTRYERRVFSQNGEDGILAAIFARIGVTNRRFIEFGVEDGDECNTRLLSEREGWSGLLMDGSHEDEARNLVKAIITAENVNCLFEQHRVPDEPDLLSIDIDGNEYWVWRALDARWRPRVVAIEYNASLGATRCASIPYDPSFRWTGTDYFGCSLRALVSLGKLKGYTLVGCDSIGVNAFFVRDDLVPSRFVVSTPDRLFRPPRYGRTQLGHRPDEARFVPDLPEDHVPRQGTADR